MNYFHFFFHFKCVYYPLLSLHLCVSVEPLLCESCPFLLRIIFKLHKFLAKVSCTFCLRTGRKGMLCLTHKKLG